LACGPLMYVTKMNALLNSDETTPSVAMELLVARHGVWKVAIALLALLARKRRREAPVRIDDLTAHMLQDIGLPPMPETRKHWELR
jgi:hypothetical protein